LGGAAPYWQTYAYNQATSNRTSLATATSGGTSTTTYSYTAGTHKLASTAGGLVGSYGYNTNGQTTTRPGGQTLTYNPTGQLATLTTGAGSQQRVYTTDGTLLAVMDSANGATVYLGDTELHAPTGATTAAQITATRTYSAAGGAQAERVFTTTSKTTYFLDTDPHNSATTTIDAATGQLAATRYNDPFGNPRVTSTGAAASTGTWPDTHGYLNAPVDTLSGLTHLGARDYDPTLGRFVTVDPIFDPTNPQQDNGYTYAFNNPITAADPSGLEPHDNACDGKGSACHDYSYGNGPPPAGGYNSAGKCGSDSQCARNTGPGSPGSSAGGGYNANTDPRLKQVCNGQCDPNARCSWKGCTPSDLGLPSQNDSLPGNTGQFLCGLIGADDTVLFGACAGAQGSTPYTAGDITALLAELAAGGKAGGEAPGIADDAVAQKAAQASTSIRVVQESGGVTEYAVDTPAGKISIMADVSKTGDTLTLDNFDIDGPGRNSLGAVGLRVLAQQLGRQEGVSQVVIRGAPRTTGPNPGSVSRPITIKVNP
jgi:RHS repeat-associated protein